MACLEMYNSSPRISFSYDFVDSHQFNNKSTTTRPTPPLPQPDSSDFEFSVSNHNMLCNDMICADELFSKGKLLPFKYSTIKPRGGGGGGGSTTLRDEMLTGQQDDETIQTSFISSSSSSKPPKSKWKAFWGLKRSHIGSKKPEKINDGSSGAMIQQPELHLDTDSNPLHYITSQEMVKDGCSSSSRDVEMGI